MTERGKPVVRIIPLERGSAEISAHVATHGCAGLVRIGTGKWPKGFWNLKSPKDKKGLLVRASLAEREEGR